MKYPSKVSSGQKKCRAITSSSMGLERGGHRVCELRSFN